jgi:hypothetical protein
MIEVLKQALDALENHCGNYKLDDAGCDRHDKAITAINQAIKELESQEPVAHQKWCASLTQLLLSMPPQPAPCNCHPPQRTWVGLTDKAITKVVDSMPRGIKGWMSDWDLYDYARAIEAKLKENT